MKPSEIKALLISRFKAGIKRPVHLESSPGVGKTQIVGQVAKELGIAFKTIHAPLLQPEDYGFPVVSADRENVRFIVSREKFPVEGSDCPDQGIFLIDELPQADNSAQKILANLIQEREIHGTRIKPGWLIVTTGNRTGDRSGANRLLTHLKNRLTSIPLEFSIDDWSTWAIENNVLPEGIAFARFRPALLNDFNPQSEVNPTPRSWVEGVFSVLGKIDPKQEFSTFCGDVGEGPAAEFCAFLNIYRKLPSPDAIMLSPSTAEVPTDAATQYAICGALSHRVTSDNFGRVMTYISRLPVEFSVLFTRDAIKKCKDIQTSPDFVKWACGPGAALLTS